MQDRLLSMPELMFIIGTRAMLGAGIALLASRHMSDRGRLAAGLTLTAIGAISTVPAVRIVAKANPSLLHRAMSSFR